MKDIKAKINPKDIRKLSGHKISNVNVTKNEISFYTDYKNIKKLSDSIENISYFSAFKYKLKNIISKYFISIIGLMVIIALLINQSKTVNEIRFVNYNTYDAEVEEYLEENFKKVGPFYYLNAPISEINLELKKRFYHYEWISVEKKGAILEVFINKQKDKDYQNIDDGVVGDYFAKSDAIIKMYYVQKGVVLIKDLQSVSKGEILITGNLKHHIGQVEYIKPYGIVIGETLTYETIEVPKKTTNTIRTGKIEIKTRFGLFNNKVKYETTFKKYDVEIKNKFNIKGLLSINKVYIYEVNNVETVYRSEDALEYAKSLIKKEFRPSKYESIISIDLITADQSNDNFYFKFVVKKNENIAKFVPLNNE